MLKAAPYLSIAATTPAFGFLTDALTQPLLHASILQGYGSANIKSWISNLEWGIDADVFEEMYFCKALLNEILQTIEFCEKRAFAELEM